MDKNINITVILDDEKYDLVVSLDQKVENIFEAISTQSRKEITNLLVNNKILLKNKRLDEVEVYNGSIIEAV